jgi:hypothetical protein
MTCKDCGKEIDLLEAFPKGRCLECHATAPEVCRETRMMTAEKLARMWGAK